MLRLEVLLLGSFHLWPALIDHKVLLLELLGLVLLFLLSLNGAVFFQLEVPLCLLPFPVDLLLQGDEVEWLPIAHGEAFGFLGKVLSLLAHVAELALNFPEHLDLVGLVFMADTEDFLKDEGDLVGESSDQVNVAASELMEHDHC